MGSLSKAEENHASNGDWWAHRDESLLDRSWHRTGGNDLLGGDVCHGDDEGGETEHDAQNVHLWRLPAGTDPHGPLRGYRPAG